MESEKHPLDKLRAAHARMCERVLEILEKDNPDVAELKLVAQFLKDNKIEALPVPGSPLGKVADGAARKNIIRMPVNYPGGSVLDEDDPAVKGSG